MDQVIQVNQALCAGCGKCMDACAPGAIYLVNHCAEIDESLCNTCGACVAVCPQVALSVTAAAAQPALAAAPPIDLHPVPSREQTVLSHAAASGSSLQPLFGTALAYFGRELAPRLVDMLVAALERRLAQPSTTAAITKTNPSSPLPAGRRGKHKQVRNRIRCERGKCGSGRNQQERM